MEPVHKSRNNDVPETGQGIFRSADYPFHDELSDAEVMPCVFYFRTFCQTDTAVSRLCSERAVLMEYNSLRFQKIKKFQLLKVGDQNIIKSENLQWRIPVKIDRQIAVSL